MGGWVKLSRIAVKQQLPGSRIRVWQHGIVYMLKMFAWRQDFSTVQRWIYFKYCKRVCLLDVISKTDAKDTQQFFFYFAFQKTETIQKENFHYKKIPLKIYKRLSIEHILQNLLLEHDICLYNNFGKAANEMLAVCGNYAIWGHRDSVLQILLPTRTSGPHVGRLRSCCWYKTVWLYWSLCLEILMQKF